MKIVKLQIIEIAKVLASNKSYEQKFDLISCLASDLQDTRQVILGYGKRCVEHLSKIVLYPYVPETLKSYWAGEIASSMLTKATRFKVLSTNKPVTKEQFKNWMLRACNDENDVLNSFEDAIEEVGKKYPRDVPIKIDKEKFLSFWKHWIQQVVSEYTPRKVYTRDEVSNMINNSKMHVGFY